MAAVFTLILLIGLELCGYYLASSIGEAVRNALSKKRIRVTPRVRGLNAIIGYATIFGIFGLLTLVL